MCRLLGISRQGYYKHTEKTNEEDILISSIVWYCQYIRAPDNLPKSGCRELWELNQQYFKDKGAKSVRLATMLDKPDRREVDVKVDYNGFTIPDEFVVGYGLDYDQRYRNLPYIGIVEFD